MMSAAAAVPPGRFGRTQQGAIEHLLRVGIEGFGPFKSAQESATEAMSGGRTKDEAVQALIRTHIAAAGAQGFVTNLGGIVTLPVMLPANVGAAYLIQTHLAASIAHVYDHDLESDEVRTAILLCLLGNAATEVLKRFGIAAGGKFSMTLIQRIPIAVIRKINERAGFMLIAKYGTKRSLVTLTKFIPFVGGIIGGGLDAISTRAVGAFAKSFFS